MTNMNDDKARRLHYIYSILLSVCIVIAGLCLILACIGIYRSGEQPFSREAVADAFSDISSMRKRIDVLIARYQSYRTLCSVISTASIILCVHTLIIMGFRPLLLKILQLSSQLFSVYFIDIGPILLPYSVLLSSCFFSS